MKLWGVGEKEKNYFFDNHLTQIWQDQLTPVIIDKTLGEASQAVLGDKSFYDFLMRNIPKPIANPSFFTAYAFTNFFASRTSNDLKNSNKRVRQRNNRKRNRPTRQRAR